MRYYTAEHLTVTGIHIEDRQVIDEPLTIESPGLIYEVYSEAKDDLPKFHHIWRYGIASNGMEVSGSIPTLDCKPEEIKWHYVSGKLIPESKRAK